MLHDTYMILDMARSHHDQQELQRAIYDVLRTRCALPERDRPQILDRIRGAWARADHDLALTNPGDGVEAVALLIHKRLECTLRAAATAYVLEHRHIVASRRWTAIYDCVRAHELLRYGVRTSNAGCAAPSSGNHTFAAVRVTSSLGIVTRGGSGSPSRSAHLRQTRICAPTANAFISRPGAQTGREQASGHLSATAVASRRAASLR